MAPVSKPLQSAKPRALTLWGTPGYRVSPSVISWTLGPSCVANVVADNLGGWQWRITFLFRATLSGHRCYRTKRGARDALVRAVKRLGLRLNPRRVRGGKGWSRG